VAGGALWLPPGKWKLGALEQLRLLRGMALATRSVLPRTMRLFNFLEERHPHYYLPVIGVEPAAQGRGVGSALLVPVLERCDREGMPAYLEASSERIRVLCLRHGFEVVEELRLPDDGPPIWRMWREPRVPSLPTSTGRCLIFVDRYRSAARRRRYRSAANACGRSLREEMPSLP
jgi:GNAT superfamily N-acetyltransferase